MNDVTQLDNPRYTKSTIAALATAVGGLVAGTSVRLTPDGVMGGLETDIDTALAAGVTWEEITQYCEENGVKGITQAAYVAYKSRL